LEHITEAINSLANLPNDLTIITGENEEVHTNRYLLSVFSPTIRHLLFASCCPSSALYLPDCSTSSIKHLLRIIQTGYTATTKATFEEVNEIVNTAKLLSIDIRELSSFKTNKLQQNVKIEIDEEVIENVSETITDEGKVDIIPKIESNSYDNQRTDKIYVDFLGDKITVLTYLCEQCAYKTTDSSNLKRHVKTKHEMVSYKCDQCDYTSPRKDTLKNHVEGRHMHDGASYLCDKCDYKTNRKKYLNVHIQTKHGGIFFSCKECEYKATQKGNLKAHVQSHHESVFHSCDHCEYKSKLKSYLKKHIKAKHDGISYSCSHCEYKASEKSTLRKHVKTVHEGFHYPCNYCEYKASQKQNLKRHIESKHEGVSYS